MSKDSEQELYFKRAVNHLKKRAIPLNCRELDDAIDTIVQVYWKIYKRQNDGLVKYYEHDFYHLDDWREIGDDYDGSE